MWEVWLVAKPNQTLFKTKKLEGEYETEELAREFAWFEWMDDPAPDKAEFYKLEVREKPDDRAMDQTNNV